MGLFKSIFDYETKELKRIDKIVDQIEALDDDAKAAVLAATIDYREEVKTDVELVSVKEI